MNKTFENVIREALKNGMTFEEVANQFANNLNKIQREETPAQKREKYLTNMHNQFTLARTAGNIQNTDIAALATEINAKNHPEWNMDQIEAFHEKISHTLDQLAAVVTDPADAFVKAIGSLINACCAEGENIDEDMEEETFTEEEEDEDGDGDQRWEITIPCKSPITGILSTPNRTSEQKITNFLKFIEGKSYSN